ncbi:hypothetical protein [Peredibacter starrii]|uniref:Secreted protein n=1 Tax=Peredibacter starrii TaxID=28202 RepID=A0AAX4HUL4_9BACT|nr:hypothetical protein [Peredibacter starrii]WPU66989.1 hypothetical protein SOO65_09520 [Peredibacter starrii]
MKKFMTIPLLAMLAIPAYAGNMGARSNVIEEEEAVYEEGYGNDLDDEMVEERMEERSVIVDDDAKDEVNYNERTRTNRERHAINTSGDASDDQ